MGNFFNEDGAAHKSDRMDWGTPQTLYDALDQEFSFTVDVCASPWNAKHNHYWDETTDGLSQDWTGHTCFMNPPFGRDIKHWIRKAHEASLAGATVVAVIPARTDTRYWHDHIEGIAEVRFIKGRLRYELPDGPNAPAPFPSAIIVWRPHQ